MDCPNSTSRWAAGLELSQPRALGAPEVCNSMQAGPNPDSGKFSSPAELASLWGTDERTPLSQGQELSIVKALLKTAISVNDQFWRLVL